ncbi:hypothetical protein [Solitalea canadensis]|uniref:Uncharacterized protein n=1 Tax=Solitalea canadensis (strain ATCC 29591 / DSM 3403 / JCM 21819 / LMG 8368 / NBRC 15130 / NCIMB 12057 / USAM 9D) TaxID=929556 RepID=H8KNA5_SOLCM|nr:hypothetical protein [Solitalea canadensis]AFD09438.1 hypothetical protein Solca_4448 [Solitalea canadensis DSM 3403]
MRKLIYVTLAVGLVITSCKKDEIASAEKDVTKERLETIARKYRMVLTPASTSDTTVKQLTEEQLIQLLEKQKKEIENDKADTAKNRLIENIKKEMLKSTDICFVPMTEARIDKSNKGVKQEEDYVPGGKEVSISDGWGGSFIVHIDYNTDRYGI